MSSASASALVLLMSINTISWAKPSMASVYAVVLPTRPAPTIPIFMIKYSFFSEEVVACFELNVKSCYLTFYFIFETIVPDDDF